MLLSILGASLLGNILARKGVTRTSEICVCNKSWWVQINWKVWATIWEQLHIYMGTILIVLVLNIFLKELKNIISNKIIKTNIYRIQAYNSITCEYFCIDFIDFMPNDKRLRDFTNLFSRNNFLKNDEIIL